MTEGGLGGTLELEREESTGGIFAAARLFGLSVTEFVCTGTLGFGGGTSFGGGAGTIVILLGPVCIWGTFPSTCVIPSWTREMPPFCGCWFMIRLGPDRAATFIRVWDIVFTLVDVVERALLVTLWAECWERAEAGRTECEGSDWNAGLGIGFVDD